ncbi:SUMF1/EgtB/PvdO family nonheme iron enzyme [Pontibacterium sp. N1Y112]|uniref:SUMF1/EgtB/PvdO family nonheme iron enzyme n=1 Tax=Pontibacterium sinense TaxID=2781979 RepID=A0A8J7JZL2_9GAMM|nr:SUMF1/EgtB/PvdO family nonheme iron enzyme [Pontibacterium sinense]MBE9398943.1 SUMF1/EgtB/PvdO family nonheme iron enzyme [Pontibacterium sinense]
MNGIRSTLHTIAPLLLVLQTLHANASPQDSPDMVAIPGATYEMGCDPNTDYVCSYVPEEKQHSVTIDAFKIDKYEVTTGQYTRCVEAGHCDMPTIGGLMHYGNPEAAEFPINGVSWYQARKFCEWKGKRLPTSAEWELAARGTDGRTYPWGFEEPDCTRTVMDRANAGYLGCGTGDTLNVGSKPKGASPYGVMDMAGNVWEWTSDWYDESYYFNSPRNNPKGPKHGELKITRGGDFMSRQGYELRATGRFPYYPSNPSPAIGFRCAK